MDLTAQYQREQRAHEGDRARVLRLIESFPDAILLSRALGLDGPINRANVHRDGTRIKQRGRPKKSA